jgi:hypothetical protein
MSLLRRDFIKLEHTSRSAFSGLFQDRAGPIHLVRQVLAWYMRDCWVFHAGDELTLASLALCCFVICSLGIVELAQTRWYDCVAPGLPYTCCIGHSGSSIGGSVQRQDMYPGRSTQVFFQEVSGREFSLAVEYLTGGGSRFQLTSSSCI